MRVNNNRPSRWLKGVALATVFAVAASACGSDDDGGAEPDETPAPAATDAPVDTDAPAEDEPADDSEDEPADDAEDEPTDDQADDSGAAAFDELVEAARESDHRVRLALEGFTPEQVEAYEEAFEARFGFPLELENEPGHQSQDIPNKVIQSAQAGRGVVDVTQGNTTNFVQMFQQGYTREPNWAALESEWPVISRLREANIPIERDDGLSMGDHCMLQGQLPWLPVYSTERVDPSELENFEWEDLTDPMWENRLVLDGRAAGLFTFPFAPGWDEDRLRVFAEGLHANNPTITSGGSSGVVQAILAGEGDIGIAVTRVVEANMAIGAPLDYAIPSDFIPVSYRTTCLAEPGVNDPAMAELFFAWANAEYIYELGAAGEPVDPRLLPEEAEFFELAQRFAERGITDEQLAYARTPEDDELMSGYRDIAIAGQSGG